ncbi:MAG: 4Fe-4S dicluster domain-containing protein [Caldimonas sp.]
MYLPARAISTRSSSGQRNEQMSSAPMSSVDSTNPAGSPGRRQGPGRSGRRPDVDARRCTGCGRCVAVCEPRLLSLEAVGWEKFSVLHDRDRCTGCSLCAVSCPFDAITMRGKVRSSPTSSPPSLQPRGSRPSS